MNTNGWALGFAPVVAMLAAGASETKRATPDEPQGLVRVQSEDADDARDVEFDRKDWEAKLSSRDLERRERDFDRMVELARTNADARSALEEWSKDSSRADLAWTSRLALREVDRRGNRFGFGFAPRAGQGQDWGRLRSRL